MEKSDETPQEVVAREIKKRQSEQALETALIPRWQASDPSRREVSKAASVLRNILLEEIEALNLYQYHRQRWRETQRQKAFPAITWRDIWLSLWGK